MADDGLFPPRPSDPTPSQLRAGVEACLTVQRRAQSFGKRPFAAVLVAPDNITVLLTHASISHVEHAEASLARLAAIHYPQPYLWRCTLYSSWEPCAMCTGTCYWANIGRIVYAASEEKLRELTGEGNAENMTLDLPCRDVLALGQKDVLVHGPLIDEGLEDEVVRESDKYWKPIRDGKGKGKV